MCHGPTLQMDYKHHLLALVTNQEIKHVFFSIRDNKAPRMDGYSAPFFKKAC